MALDRLNTALDLLDRAIVRLDMAVEARLARAPAASDDFERHALETALGDAQAAEREAKDRAAELSARLDGAIDRLRLVLED